MISINKVGKNVIVLKLTYNENDYEIKAVVSKYKINISAYIKYTFLDNSSFRGNVINNYTIGSYPIVFSNEDTRDTVDLALSQSFNTLRSTHFPNIDKAVFEIFSIKIQDLYMEVIYA